MNFSFRPKNRLRHGDCLNSKICDLMEPLGRPIPASSKSSNAIVTGNSQSTGELEYSETEEYPPEDRLFDEMPLRELVKSERRRAESALAELEKERSVAATAAEEAMSMILRLQREKSSIEIEAKQYIRLAEEKQRHDQEVIRYLRSVIVEQEKDLSFMESELRLRGRRLSQHSLCDSGDEEDDAHQRHGDGDSAMGGSSDEDLEDELIISSLEFDSWALL